MKVDVLIDNSAPEGLASEWGLSFHIEHKGRKYLLDTGASDAFIHNARTLGINLRDVDCAVLSHAHYDHSGGIPEFLGINSKAPLYVSPAAGENCYSRHFLRMKYIGVEKGLLESAPERIVRRPGVISIGEEAWVVPHSAACSRRTALKSGLYIRKGLRFVPDDFSHEQSLVFGTDGGLVIFNSCSHSGPDVIVEEVRAALPGRRIRAYIGGLHLFRLGEADVEEMARRLDAAGVEEIYAGHCTGDRAFALLEGNMKCGLTKTCSGMTVIFD